MMDKQYSSTCVGAIIAYSTEYVRGEMCGHCSKTIRYKNVIALVGKSSDGPQIVMHVRCAKKVCK